MAGGLQPPARARVTNNHFYGTTMGNACFCGTEVGMSRTTPIFIAKNWHVTNNAYLLRHFNCFSAKTNYIHVTPKSINQLNIA